MTNLSMESTPRERLSRLLVILSRMKMFWRSSLVLGATGLALALGLAWSTKPAFRSETTVLFRGAIQTRDSEQASQRAARLGPKLKDLLYARPELEQVIDEFHLFPAEVKRSMVDAVEAMKLAIDFRARSTDSFAISFTYDDPEVARKVTARLTDLMIEEYHRQNLDTATSTQEFLHRELEEANGDVDEASRALATFLAHHPQFQWGLNDSPYAQSIGGAPGIGGGRQAPPRPALEGPKTPQDPGLSAMERELGRIEARLLPPAAPGAAPAAPPSSIAEAQKQRDAAAAALAAAQAQLREKLATVTPAHPDAISAQAKVVAAQRDLAAAEAAIRIARSGGAGEARDAAPLDPAARADLVRQRDGLRRQIADRRAQIASADPAPPPASSAARAPTGSAKKAPDVVDLETEWHRLRLELDRARDQLRLVQTNAHVADMAADAAKKEQKEELYILEPAYRPTRPDRGRGRVFFAGAIVAIFFAAGYAVARVLLNDTLIDEGDITALGGPPALVSMPMIDRGAEGRPLVVASRPSTPPARAAARPPPPPPAAGRSAYRPDPRAPDRVSVSLAVRGKEALVEAVFEDPEVEVIGEAGDPTAAFGLLGRASPEAVAALRVLRHRLEQRRRDEGFVVSVVSPRPGEGKTLLAAQLALTLSESDRASVVLVEGNLERPSVAAMLGIRVPGGAGLSAQVQDRRRGGARPWAVVRAGASLTVLGEPDRAAADPAALHSTQFEDALAALRRVYDYVVIDGPAVLGSGDANVIEGVSDGVLVVARAAETKGAALSRAVIQLGDRRILGVVLNGVVQ